MWTANNFITADTPFLSVKILKIIDMRDDAIQGKTRTIFINHFISYVYAVATLLLFTQ